MSVVYCRNCECCEGRHKSEKICMHRKNLTGKDWYEYGTPVKTCQELNKNNDCEWFIQKVYSRH